MHKQWKQGQASWEEHRDAAWLCRDGVRKAKVQLEMNLARDTMSDKGFYESFSQKRNIKEVIPPNEQDRQIGNNRQGEGLSTQLFCLSVYWKPPFLYLSSGWTTRWGPEGAKSLSL